MGRLHLFQVLLQTAADMEAVTITAHQTPALVAAPVAVALAAHLLLVMLEVLVLKVITVALELEIQTTTAVVAEALGQ
jgi:hypothetical protein